ncbi:unnamed protein product, partial [Aphanomyces euteiches]
MALTKCVSVYSVKTRPILFKLTRACCLPPKAKDKGQDRTMIGRVVIAPGARGSGQARVLTEMTIEICLPLWPQLGNDLGAQAYLETFYS